jgi:hypothetical protein
VEGRINSYLLPQFRDALNHTKEKGVELQKQYDELKIRTKSKFHLVLCIDLIFLIENETSSPGPRTSAESAPIGLLNDALSALVSSVSALYASGREISATQHELPHAFQLPQLSIALFGRLLPYAAKRDEKFQGSFLNLLYILLRQESSGVPNRVLPFSLLFFI